MSTNTALLIGLLLLLASPAIRRRLNDRRPGGYDPRPGSTQPRRGARCRSGKVPFDCREDADRVVRRSQTQRRDGYDRPLQRSYRCPHCGTGTRPRSASAPAGSGSGVYQASYEGPVVRDRLSERSWTAQVAAESTAWRSAAVDAAHAVAIPVILRPAHQTLSNGRAWQGIWSGYANAGD
jgi:hypothetical protein